MDNLDYIESYFTNTLVSGQAREFEKRIESDPVFAEEVAFYLSALQVTRETSHLEMKAKFREIYRKNLVEGEETNPKIDSISPSKENSKNSPVRKLVYYMAAAAAVACIVIGIQVFKSSGSPQQLADQYIKENLLTLGVTMSSLRDSIQTGLQLYNEGKFREALAHFEMMRLSDTSSFTVKEYAGLSALRLKEYNKALSYFEQLEIYNNLYANPALILQSVTLMERSQPGDAAKAKLLLQKIVDQDLEGKVSAQEWLRKL